MLQGSLETKNITNNCSYWATLNVCDVGRVGLRRTYILRSKKYINNDNVCMVGIDEDTVSNGLNLMGWVHLNLLKPGFTS